MIYNCLVCLRYVWIVHMCIDRSVTAITPTTTAAALYTLYLCKINVLLLRSTLWQTHMIFCSFDIEMCADEIL